MGENAGLADPGEPLANGLLSGAGPVMQPLDADRWLEAEERTAELIACIQPNQPSENRRKAVAEYVQRLIMQCFPCQVCTFGSVPLKTYLPDGDIDLTAFSQDQNLKDSWANQVRDMLEHEEKNANAEFHVKEVQYIQAEVKIIKCLVENIVVDISFNQVGGLCTLCFLDEVDNLINQNHLFKRSIILIKAWCYYESRILGAHHGLISTYALETLVLYIFHVFNNSFHGPLEVLYRFLEFFSNFDWDNFCVSLWGPVPISSLPDVTAEPPRKDSGKLLLSKVFLDSCSFVYAVFPGGQENNGQPFVSKHFNVIDPLRVNNNLGRSVSKGNFFRIRSAFAFGAKRLARLLDCPKENLIFEVNQFFFNTWERHGSGHRPDAPAVDSRHLSLSTPDSPHENENSKNNTTGKRVKNENFSGHGKNSSRTSDLNISDKVLPNDKVQRDLKPDNLGNDTQGRFVFARTRSSPELTDAYGDVSSQIQRNRKAETSSDARPTSRPDSGNRRKYLGSDGLASHSRRSSVEDMRQVPFQQSLDPVIDSNSISNSYQRDSGLDSLSDELMNQEEQDIVNMMASTSLQGFNGQVHVPFGLPSGHLPYSIPPSFLASMGYNQRNLPGFPTNIPLMDPSFSHMQFPHSLFSPQLTHYFPGIGLNSPSEDSVERSNENFSLHSGEGNDYWHEQDDPENDDFDKFQSDDKNKPPAPLSGLKYVPPPVRGSHSATRVHQKHPREKHGSVNIDLSQIQNFKNSEVYADERPASSRFSSATHSNSLRSRTSSESSWDGSSVKTPKSAKEKRGKKIVSADLAASHGKGKIMSNDDDDDQEWGSLTEMADRNPGPEPIAPLQVPRPHMPGFEVAQNSGSDSMMPYGPMLIGPGPRNRTNDNSGLIAFYPTGPPIPFLTMLPVYNVPHGAGTSDASSSHFGGDESLDNSESNFSPEGFNQFNQSEDLNSLRGSTNIDTSVEHKPDILNSDFASHWQNLQFGRFCQNPPFHAPLVYPSPMMVPPVYLQGRFPHDNLSRPVTTNTNIFSQIMTSYGNRAVPVAPLQSVSSRHPNMYQPYVDDMPRYRSGTGTYLPNPKVSSPRERHSGGRRGNYNHDRSDSYADRDNNWNASKSRGGARGHNRSQTDKPNSRTDRFTPNESRSDRSWNRHDSIPSYQSQNGPLRSNPSQNGPQNVAYTMYPLGPTNPNGVSNGSSGQPVMMLYPFDQNSTYGPPGEQLEFGSLSQVGFPGINEQLQLNEGTQLRAFEENRRHGRSGHRSSPDQPSSPHQHRRA